MLSVVTFSNVLGSDIKHLKKRFKTKHISFPTTHISVYGCCCCSFVWFFVCLFVCVLFVYFKFVVVVFCLSFICFCFVLFVCLRFIGCVCVMVGGGGGGGAGILQSKRFDSRY